MDSSELSKVGVDPQFRAIDDFESQVFAYARQNATGRAYAAFGPATIKIETCGTLLKSIALDSLHHAATRAKVPADLHLVMIDGKETGIDSLVLDDLAIAHNGSSGHRGISTRRSTLTIDEEWNTRHLIDANNRCAIVWIADTATVPFWVVYDKIHKAVHWLSYGRNFGLVHSAALRVGDVGCLIAGKGGSGKSTFTTAAVAHGFETAGDDCVLIETTAIPRVHAIFNTIKLDDKSLARFPQLQPLVRNPLRRSEDKAIIHLIDAYPDCIVSGFPLHVMLRAQLTGELQSRIVPLTTSDAFIALAPSSLLLLQSQGRQITANCAKLAGNLGTYAFEIGTDVDAAVAELAEFLRGIKR